MIRPLAAFNHFTPSPSLNWCQKLAKKDGYVKAIVFNSSKNTIHSEITDAIL